MVTNGSLYKNAIRHYLRVVSYFLGNQMKLLKATTQGNNLEVHEVSYRGHHYDWYIYPDYIKRWGVRIGWY